MPKAQDENPDKEECDEVVECLLAIHDQLGDIKTIMALRLRMDAELSGNTDLVDRVSEALHGLMPDEDESEAPT